jgi:hypothetical protein
MEKSEQRVVIKFLWMKGLGARHIQIKLSQVLGDDCYSPAAIERWLARFREGDLSWPDRSRSGRPVIHISECLGAFLDKFAFQPLYLQQFAQEQPVHPGQTRKYPRHQI